MTAQTKDIYRNLRLIKIYLVENDAGLISQPYSVKFEKRFICHKLYMFNLSSYYNIPIYLLYLLVNSFISESNSSKAKQKSNYQALSCKITSLPSRLNLAMSLEQLIVATLHRTNRKYV